jgi:alpha-L-arabinofuranosidase
LSGFAAGKAQVTILQSADLNAENSFEHPTAVAPASSVVEVTSSAVPVRLQPYSLTVYRFATR